MNKHKGSPHLYEGDHEEEDIMAVMCHSGKFYSVPSKQTDKMMNTTNS